jgi:hypothetical protein
LRLARTLGGNECMDVAVATDFGRYLGRTGTLLKIVARPALSSPSAAAARLLRAATADLSYGTYYHRHRHRLRTPSGLVADSRLQDAAWNDAMARLNRTDRA